MSYDYGAPTYTPRRPLPILPAPSHPPRLPPPSALLPPTEDSFQPSYQELDDVARDIYRSFYRNHPTLGPRVCPTAVHLDVQLDPSSPRCSFSPPDVPSLSPLHRCPAASSTAPPPHSPPLELSRQLPSEKLSQLPEPQSASEPTPLPLPVPLPPLPRLQGRSTPGPLSTIISNLPPFMSFLEGVVRANFYRSLTGLHIELGTRLVQQPLVCGGRVDLWSFYREVIKRGGVDLVSKKRQFADIAKELALNVNHDDVCYRLKQAYLKYLKCYEDAHFLGPNTPETATIEPHAILSDVSRVRPQWVPKMKNKKKKKKKKTGTERRIRMKEEPQTPLNNQGLWATPSFYTKEESIPESIRPMVHGRSIADSDSESSLQAHRKAEENSFWPYDQNPFDPEASYGPYNWPPFRPATAAPTSSIPGLGRRRRRDERGSGPRNKRRRIKGQLKTPPAFAEPAPRKRPCKPEDPQIDPTCVVLRDLADFMLAYQPSLPFLAPDSISTNTDAPTAYLPSSPMSPSPLTSSPLALPPLAMSPLNSAQQPPEGAGR